MEIPVKKRRINISFRGIKIIINRIEVKRTEKRELASYLEKTLLSRFSQEKWLEADIYNEIKSTHFKIIVQKALDETI